MKQKLPGIFLTILLLLCAFLVGSAGGRLDRASRAGQQAGGDGKQESGVENTPNEADGANTESGKDGENNSEDDEKSDAESDGENAQVMEGGDRGTILVDPGHGGRDPGMVGVDGLEEKGVNLGIAEKLQELLAVQGFRVVLTRTGDYGLYDEDTSNKKAQDMQRRCALIEEEKPLVTVSIHQNSYSDSSVCGPQVFYYEHSAEGKELASLIQEQMNSQLQIARPREIKSNDSYYILKRSPSVTALVECSFLSNPEEAAKIQTEEYQEAVAKAIGDGVLEYLGEVS